MDNAQPTPASKPSAEAPGTPPAPAAGKQSKSEQTRSLILETALRLFQERGYDKTTMRAIATEAGVSVGNAYYYFESKEHLIQGFYDRVTREHIETARSRLARRTEFASRLQVTLEAWLDVAEPFHGFAVQFFRNAADPDSPLSPFSAESYPARQTVVDLYREVLAGSAMKLDAEMSEILPELLWLHQMGIVLFWVYDRTPNSQKTRDFVKRTTPMVARVITLSRYKLIRPLVRDADKLIRDFIVPENIGKAED
ncbi:TetR/AcrR family transcriptional regulator [Yinghuangia soli]|uniref:TetR family transcriptional regulator n=1 Tax=Yinghuangia soli TaxID=2908204 RepID=A0AA41U5Z0_9ACTN|nr:TetR family transcriptional regulator [Yinghuangia soli]MCF2532397.1 TetR family transcriptional regulator [Yinghuangia soli]